MFCRSAVHIDYAHPDISEIKSLIFCVFPHVNLEQSIIAHGDACSIWQGLNLDHK